MSEVNHGKTLRIIILEDRSSDADLVEFELQEAGFVYAAKRVETEKEYIQALQEFSPDLILSDYDLPQYNGALALAEAKARCPEVPFILVTGAVGEDRAIEMLTSGAKDYVMKHYLHRLAPAAQRVLAQAEGQKALKRAEEKLREAHNNLERQIQKKTAELRAEKAARKQMEEKHNKLVHEHQEAIARVKQLSGMLPVCTRCKERGDDRE